MFIFDLIFCDMDGDTKVNIVDLTYLVGYLFGGGSEPVSDCCD